MSAGGLLFNSIEVCNCEGAKELQLIYKDIKSGFLSLKIV